MKCDNCSNDAVYLVAPLSANAVNYCAGCLPSFLQANADAGLYAYPVVEAPASKKKAADPAPVADPAPATDPAPAAE